MEENYKEAFYEVNCILNMLPKELSSKIPKTFKMAIEKNKSDTYYKEIKEPLEQQQLKQETIVILGMIYRDFIKRKTQNIDLNHNHSNVQENYNIIFNKDKNNSLENNQQLLIVQEEKWYSKFIKSIKNSWIGNLFVNKKNKKGD